MPTRQARTATAILQPSSTLNPPESLSPRAKNLFEGFMAQLPMADHSNAGLIQIAAAAAVSAESVEVASAALERDGHFISDPVTGKPIAHPALRTVKECTSAVVMCIRAMGALPSRDKRQRQVEARIERQVGHRPVLVRDDGDPPDWRSSTKRSRK